MDTDAAALRELYVRYLAACNAREWDRLAAFVHPDVAVDGRPRGLERYVDALRDLVAALPDHHWRLDRLVVEPPWLAVLLTDTGTHTGGRWLGVAPGGAAVRVTELALYRVAGGRIVEVHSQADDLGVQRLLQEHERARAAAAAAAATAAEHRG